MLRRRQPVDRSGYYAPALLAICLCAHAGDDRLERPVTISAPLELPHVTELALAERARKRPRRSRNVESYEFLDLTPGLEPVTWPKNTDLRARLLTTELRDTPLLGWLAENLYRSKKERGWCVEVDPGEGEYMVFYRYLPRN